LSGEAALGLWRLRVELGVEALGTGLAIETRTSEAVGTTEVPTQRGPALAGGSCGSSPERRAGLPSAARGLLTVADI